MTLTVEPADRRVEPRQRGAEPGRRGALLRGLRHRHRHPVGQAADHLRGVPAGRRLDQPQVRRHRPRAGDQPRAVAAARRRNPAVVGARPGQHLPPVPAGDRTRRRRRARKGTPESSAPTPLPSPRGEAASDRNGHTDTPATLALERNRRAESAFNAEPEEVGQLVNEVGDDRDDIRPGDRVLLIVENDVGFARFLLDAAREKGFKGLVTSLGAVGPRAGPRVQAGRHHASTSTCRTSTAGACWSGSRTTWRPGTSRSA